MAAEDCGWVLVVLEPKLSLNLLGKYYGFTIINTDMIRKAVASCNHLLWMSYKTNKAPSEMKDESMHFCYRRHDFVAEDG